MPISSIPSYLSTGDTFLEHWLLVEDSSGASFTLQTGQGRDDLSDMRDAAAAAIAAVEGPLNDLSIAGYNLLTKRAEIVTLISEFNRTVRYQFRVTGYPRSLKKVPSKAAGLGAMMSACKDVSNLWAKINTNTPPVAGFTPPFLLGTLTLAQFNTKVDALEDAFTVVKAREMDVLHIRDTRDTTLVPLRAIMVLYRQAVLASFPPGDPLVTSCPAVTPPPGSTPDAVHIGAAWDATIGKARIVCTDPAANVTELEVRACDPPKYKGDEEQVVGSIPLDENELITDFGLLVPGAAKIFAVYTMTPTGNEKRSNTVKVTRP